MNKHNLQVGQKLFLKLYYARGEKLEEYEVEKIGRVYATLKHPYYRVNLETLVLDGSRGTVWLSEEQYKKDVEISKAWEDFRGALVAVWHRRPSHIDLEIIKEVRARLGI